MSSASAAQWLRIARKVSGKSIAARASGSSPWPGTTTCVASPLDFPWQRRARCPAVRQVCWKRFPRTSRSCSPPACSTVSSSSTSWRKGRWLREIGMMDERRTSADEDARARAWSSWRCRDRGRQPGTRRAVQSAGAHRQPAERRHRA